MARQNGRGKCIPLLPLLPEHISPGSQLEAGHRSGRSCSWFQPPRRPPRTVDTTLHQWARGARGCLCETKGSSSQKRPGFPPHSTRRAWTERALQETPPTENFPHSVQSGRPTAAAKWRARGVGGSEGDAEDPPEHAEETDEVAHQRRSDSDPGEGIGQDLRNSQAGIRELHLEIKRERGRNRVPELGTEKSVACSHHTAAPSEEDALLLDPRGLAAAGTYGSPRAKIQALRGESTAGAAHARVR
jgi:hypothetical protein